MKYHLIFVAFNGSLQREETPDYNKARQWYADAVEDPTVRLAIMTEEISSNEKEPVPDDGDWNHNERS